MRVSTSFFTQRGLASMLAQQKRLSDIQQQVATGKRLLRPSDDPTGAAQILRLEQAVATTDQYQRNSDAALNRLTLEEATLNSVQESLLRVRELAIQGSNSTFSYSDRLALGQEVRERLNEIVSLANTRDANQEYLFSGYKVSTKPFAQAANGSFIYNGDQGQRALQISSGRQIADSDSGNNIFVNMKNGNGSFQVNGTPVNILTPGSFTTAASNGNVATATVNTVTAIAGMSNGAGQVFSLEIDGVNAVSATLNNLETFATGSVATEIDADLTAFVAASSGAYTIVSGALSTGNLVLSKTDGTAITFDTATNSTLGAVAASVTESETTAGVTANAVTDTAFTMSVDGTQFFTKAAGLGVTVTAAEIDAALSTFVNASGGAYTIDSGSIATGTLVLSKADGTSVAMTVDSNFSLPAGSFTGSLVSALNSGAAVFNIGQVVDPAAYVAETYTVSIVTNANGNLGYNVVGSVSGQLIPPSPQNIISNAPDYVDGGTIIFNGIQTGFTGTPVVGDTFSVTPSNTQDMFSSVQKLITAFEIKANNPSQQSDIFNLINQSISEIDIAFDNVIRVRTSVGARLKTIEDQVNINSIFKIEMVSTLSSVRDLDIANAAVELQSRMIALEAAQVTYTRIQGLSLFNFL